MKITEEEQQARKLRIVYSAFCLFSKRGIDRVTLAEVARASGVSETSIYRYFETKLDLAMETISVLWEEIVTEMTRHIDAPSYRSMSGFEQLRTLIDGFELLFEDKLNYILFSYDYKLYLIRHDATLPAQRLLDELAPMSERYLRALRKGLQDGSIRPLGEPEDLYWAIWGMIRGYMAKIAIYDKLYKGENVWRKRFHLARTLLEAGLAGRPSDEAAALAEYSN